MRDTIHLIYRGAPPNLVCCDTTLRRMPNGDWVTFLLSGGPTEPCEENRVFACRSTDRGQTWSAPERVFPDDPRPMTLSEVIVHDGRVTLFASSHNGRFLDWTTWVTTSDDSGRTWGPLSPLPFRPRYSFVRTLLVLRDGRWLLPYQCYDFPADEERRLLAEERCIWDAPQIQPENGVLISNDAGTTWACADPVRHPRGESWFWAENNLAELSDGTVVMLTRRDGLGVLLRNISHDRGQSWSATEPSDIPNPGAKIRLFNLPDGRIALLHNPAPSRGRGLLDRNPLSLWISDDDMRTWAVQRDLVTFPGWLSYPDGFFDAEEGAIHFAFDYNRHDALYVGVWI
jgi:predicted neuraminidase